MEPNVGRVCSDRRAADYVQVLTELANVAKIPYLDSISSSFDFSFNQKNKTMDY